MTEKKKDARVVRLDKVRLSFPTLRRKEASVPGGREKYSASFIIDPNTPLGRKAIEDCKKAIAAAETVTFQKAGVVKTIDDPKRVAFRPGSKFKNQEGEVYRGYEGMVGLTTTNPKTRPRLLNKERVEVELEDIEDVFYGGCVVDAWVAFYCVKEKDQGGRGLFCSVESIRSLERGEAFGGGLNITADDYDDDDEEEEEDDGLGDGDGDGDGDDDDLLG